MKRQLITAIVSSVFADRQEQNNVELTRDVIETISLYISIRLNKKGLKLTTNDVYNAILDALNKPYYKSDKSVKYYKKHKEEVEIASEIIQHKLFFMR